jgi:hypothetical protein
MIMAKFYAISGADIVGSMDSLPIPALSAIGGSTNAFFAFFPPPVPPTEYTIYNTDAAFAPTSKITSFSHLTVAPPFAPGAGQVDHVWRADSGDSYLLGSFGVPSVDTLFGLLSPKVGDPTKTHGTEQQIHQFFFKLDDKIQGSTEDDKLCGWAEDDTIWGGEGDDEFYYGAGMGKDKIMDLKKGDDEVIFDEDLVGNFKQLSKVAKLKNDKVVLKFDSSDKLTIFGIDTLKELKKVAAFDDFTDFA